MKSYLKWTVDMPPVDGTRAITCIAFDPSGTHVIIGAGSRLLMYDAMSGSPLKKMNPGHGGTVYCVSYCHDGKLFASGASDTQVIIWSSSGVARLRYPHHDSIQALCWNPVESVLASCSSFDFGVYDPRDTDVTKNRVRSKITCCCWANDGQHLALGHVNGTITLHNRSGEETVRIERGTKGSPIWSVSFNPSPRELDILTVGSWDQTLSFYLLSGKQVGADRELGFDPTCITYYSNGEYFLVAGSDRKCTIWKKEGIPLVTVSPPESSWIWCVAQSPTANILVLGTEDGQIKCYHLVFSMVHGIYGDLYAYRDCLTDVIVRDLGQGIVGNLDGAHMVQGSLPTGGGPSGTGGSGISEVITAKTGGVDGGSNDGGKGVNRNRNRTNRNRNRSGGGGGGGMIDSGMGLGMGIGRTVVAQSSTRIHCKKYITKIAVYKWRVAVKSQDSIIVYDVGRGFNHPGRGGRGSPGIGVEGEGGGAPGSGSGSGSGSGGIGLGGGGGMQTQIRARIKKRLSCKILMVTSLHVLVVHTNVLDSYTFRSGIKERSWVFQSEIMSAKVVGGPEGREGVLVGLRGDGEVFLVFVNNPFPVLLVSHGTSIRAFDLSRKRDRLAVVDERRELVVYDLSGDSVDDPDGEEVSGGSRAGASVGAGDGGQPPVVFRDRNVSSVAWNQCFNRMMCYGDNRSLYLKTEDFPCARYKFRGFIVGFKGSQVYGFYVDHVRSVNVPHSAALRQFIQRKLFKKAYKVASLGVTDDDWRELAFAAMLNLNFDIAKKAFIRIREVKYIDLLHSFQQAVYNGTYNEKLFLAEMHAVMGRFREASEFYAAAGKAELAIDMYCDLRMWGEAQKIAGTMQTKDEILIRLMLREAQSAVEDGDFQEAAKLFGIAGNFVDALRLMSDKQWDNWEKDMLDLAMSFDATRHRRELNFVIATFEKKELLSQLVALYEKLQMWEKLVGVHVRLQNWEEAKELITKDPSLKSLVFVPYARFLTSQGKFDEAIEMLEKAGKPLEMALMMEVLAHNAIIEHRFDDAAKYFIRLSFAVLGRVDRRTQRKEEMVPLLHKFGRFQKISYVYYAYSCVHRYTESPFSWTPPRYVFNMARYVLANISREVPYGVSKVYVMLALARLGTGLGHYKFARDAYQRLQGLRVPLRMVDSVELETIKMNGKPMSDDDEAMPICFRCSSSNPLITTFDRCGQCGNLAIRCFLSFENLPLVPFSLPTGMQPSEAVELIKSEHSRRRGLRPEASSGWSESASGGVEELSFGDAPSAHPAKQQQDEIVDGYDIFRRMLVGSGSEDSNRAKGPVKVTRPMLCSFRKEDVFVVSLPCEVIRPRFMLNIFPERVRIHQCRRCNSFFRRQDLDELLLRSNNVCPVCGEKMRR